jgi:hypothetical protein
MDASCQFVGCGRGTAGTGRGPGRQKAVALDGALTLPQAMEEPRKLHVDRTRDQLPVMKRTPKFSDYATATLNKPAPPRQLVAASSQWGPSPSRYCQMAGKDIRVTEMGLISPHKSSLCGCPPGFVRKLNSVMREGKYNDDIWEKNIGRSLEKLGNEWKPTL